MASMRLAAGDRIGVPWLGGVDGHCRYCLGGAENLCDAPTFTGYDVDGGYAEYAVARADFTFPIPDGYPDDQAAPLLCAGLIGYRALKLARVEPLGGPGRLGLYGFGASAHIVIQVARHLGHEVYVFARGESARQFARELGAAWAGGVDEPPPMELDSAIIFAPAGDLVPPALRAVRKGGVVVCAGIHMTPIPALEYELLWGERVLRSVANLTRRDGHEFLRMAPEVPVRLETTRFDLESANDALRLVKAGDFRGAAVWSRRLRAVLPEEVFGERPQKSRCAGAVRVGHVALEAAKHHDRLAAVLVAAEPGRGGGLVRDRRDRRGQLPAERVLAAAPVVDRLQSRAADRDVDLPEPPGAAEAVRHDDGRALAEQPAEVTAQAPSGLVGVLRQERDGLLVGHVRRIDARVRAHLALPRPRYQDAVLRADHLRALLEHDLHHPCVLPELCGERASGLRGLHLAKVAKAPLRLGHDLLGDDEHVPAGERHRGRAGRVCDRLAEIAAGRKLRQPRQRGRL